MSTRRHDALLVDLDGTLLDESGKIQFRDDVYGRDRKVSAAMKRARTLERRSS